MLRKLLVLLLVAALFASAFTSCDRSAPPSPDESSIDPADTTGKITTGEITTDGDSSGTEKFSTSAVDLDIFDPTLSHKPSEYDVMCLLLDLGIEDMLGEFIEEKNIPYSTIIERLGKPHDYGPPQLIGAGLVWYTENGLYVIVSYYTPDGTPSDVDFFQRVQEYDTVWMMGICRQENSIQSIPSYLFEK